jgi:hypothetical protein
MEIEMTSDVRKWYHYLIEMPLSKDGQGPATVGVDAASISYEVWDQSLNSHASFDNLQDAINEAMRLNGEMVNEDLTDAITRAEKAEAEVARLQDAGDLLANRAEAGVGISDAVTGWDKARAALKLEPIK